ncbi:zeta toxin family protein [Pedobacter nutrimenti]|jgi:predicted ABC-type ATPase|uniref:zeta toxin family protein n=1 Tax=Pedobacter nutrimenti TaxID=1241337 RepID=UPI002931AA0A|nr:zeta toxin family protein [Pedobacter nutrimenti]
MDQELKKLKQQYLLAPEKVNEISERIIHNNTLGITSVKDPHVIILGGQPGSGKGELITQAQDVLGINTVTCNADDYRDQHPLYQEIKSKHEKYYPDITADYSLVWNDRLRKHCEDNDFNYILETTFSSGDRMNDTIHSMKNIGYTVSVMLLSVHHNLSFLGTRLRYEAMRAQSGYGRLVSKHQHDLRYNAIMDTLERVFTAKAYDNIYIYARAGRKKLKGTSVGLRMLSKNGENPLQDYMDERGKHWSENDLRFFTSDILQLIKQMIWRGAGNDELKEIFEVFDLEKVEDLLAPELS